MKGGRSRRWLVFGLALAACVAAVPADAQTNTASIRGVVSDDTAPLPGATVVAVGVASGFTYNALTNDQGGFFLAALPPGRYEIKVSAPAFKEQSQTVNLQLGQSATVNFRLTLDGVFAEEITVVGERVFETRTSEIGTNITPEQIEYLPQGERNFLNFTALAPGMYVTRDENATQTFRSGGQSSRQVNAFIDGLSYKNDMLEGGSFMQDSSKGNPFPQNAVQEFQVLTQNYKAEYEKASAAVVTAVTKSGGNEWHGDVFWFYQNDGMVTQDPVSEARGLDKPDYARDQYGLSIGGPLIKDKLHLFASIERNEQDRFNQVYYGGQWDSAPAEVRDFLSTYPIGNVAAPFESTLLFAKLSWQPTVGHDLWLSYSGRDEDEIRGFGGQRVDEGAEDFQISTDALVGKWTSVIGDSIFNEASVSAQNMRWFPTAYYPEIPRQNYIGLLDVGGKDSSQDFEQDRIGLRDDVTFFFSGWGEHTMKGGVGASWIDYSIVKDLYGNPYFEFRSDEQWAYPFQARYGYGDPELDFSNTQVGLFLQDDWRVTSNLTLNLGVRWDYESNMLNNDFVTPPALVDAMGTACRTYDNPVGGQSSWCLDEFLDFDRYTTDGDQRDPYYGMIQPRVGMSWDVTGDATTVVFAGWGKYYDRVLLNDIFDEAYRQQYGQYTFCFSDTGDPRPGCSVPPIVWDDSYLSAEALDQLIASGQAPGPEIFLVNNEMKPPRSEQWTAGVRQRIGSDWLASLSYAGVRGHNGMAWFFGDLPPGTAYNDRWGGNVPIPGYARLFVTSTARESWYDAVYLTLDRPYNNNWSFNLVYTHTQDEATGPAAPSDGVVFGAFDFINSDAFSKHPGDYDETHRIVMNGTYGLPWGFRASGVITLGSGLPYTLYDASQGWDNYVIRWNEGTPRKYVFLGLKEWAYRSVDLRLEWETAIANDYRLTLIAEALNTFDSLNESCYGWTSGFMPPAGETNTGFGKGECAINARRLQAGLRFSF